MFQLNLWLFCISTGEKESQRRVRKGCLVISGFPPLTTKQLGMSRYKPLCNLSRSVFCQLPYVNKRNEKTSSQRFGVKMFPWYILFRNLRDARGTVIYVFPPVSFPYLPVSVPCPRLCWTSDRNTGSIVTYSVIIDWLDGDRYSEGVTIWIVWNGDIFTLRRSLFFYLMKHIFLSF